MVTFLRLFPAVRPLCGATTAAPTLLPHSLFPPGLKVDLHELVLVELFIQSLDDVLGTNVVLFGHERVHIFLLKWSTAMWR